MHHDARWRLNTEGAEQHTLKGMEIQKLFINITSSQVGAV
jgi:hypothetical protein